MLLSTSSRPSRGGLATSLSVLLTLLIPDVIGAHGLHGHVHVTGWAIENLPQGELRDFFSDPEVKLSALAGAMFPDTGYALEPNAREYGEYAHWEPFIESFIQKIRRDHGPPYDTLEKRKLIAFMMGAAAHGLQDELFDSTFLYEVEQREMGAQDQTDPATDGFLVLDGHARLLPNDYLPMSELLPLFSGLPVVTDAALIEKHVDLVRSLYVNEEIGWKIAAHTGTMLRPQLPWTAAHYLDFAVPGSLASEIRPTAAYMQALWDRIHGRFDPGKLVIHAWPNKPRRLREADHQSVASWVTLIVGKGVMNGTASGALTDAQGKDLGLDFRYTRWGGNGASRLVRFIATADYQPAATYTATIRSGATLVDGTMTIQSHSVQFQVECATPDDSRCPVLADLAEPLLEPPPPPPPAPEASGCSAARSTGNNELGAALLLLLCALAAIRRSAMVS